MRNKKTALLTARFTTEEEAEINKFVNKNNDFESTAEAMRVFTLFGMRFFKLKKLAENPTFVNELEKQFHIQITKPSIEKIVKHMDITEVDALMLKLADVRDEKFNELIKV